MTTVAKGTANRFASGWVGVGRGGWFGRPVRGRSEVTLRWGMEVEQVTRLFELVALRGTEEAVRADFGESAREDVLQEAVDEELDRQVSSDTKIYAVGGHEHLRTP